MRVARSCGRFVLRRATVANKSISGCSACGYPLRAKYIGEVVTCPMCTASNEAVPQTVTGSISQHVSIPTPVLIGVLSFFAGVILGPSLIASTSEGRTWLEKQAREAIRR